MNRPDSFEFTMGFVGDPENEKLRALLLDAWSRMDRARNILHGGNPNSMWLMLDTQCDRDKLAAISREGK